eukprot:GAHX01004790.1.p1 GENE.GAHX01004790.1~~GAHX01004790.1.p1  ORF type:complete len:77 (-),score=0.86 GAHX01004790.1:45-275(-)
MLRRCPERGKRFQPHMERSGMWGYKDAADKGVLKERYKMQHTKYPVVLSLTPHFASLHVGLKSLAPSGYLHSISIR